MTSVAMNVRQRFAWVKVSGRSYGLNACLGLDVCLCVRDGFVVGLWRMAGQDTSGCMWALV